MASCELCGKETSVLLQTRLEESTLQLCGACSKHGQVLDNTREKPKTRFALAGVQGPELTVIEDYAKKIKKAREQKDLTQKELAEKLALKESIITKIESGHQTPELVIAKKLERFLDIVLIEKIKEEVGGEKIDFKDSNMTIGDLMKKYEK